MEIIERIYKKAFDQVDGRNINWRSSI